jgi:hypothetical protein
MRIGFHRYIAVFVAAAPFIAAGEGSAEEYSVYIGQWVNPQSGEVFSFKSDLEFNYSALGSGKLEPTLEYGANYKFGFRSGDICWYSVTTLQNGRALNLNVRHESSPNNCPKGFFEKVDNPNNLAPPNHQADNTRTAEPRSTPSVTPLPAPAAAPVARSPTEFYVSSVSVIPETQDFDSKGNQSGVVTFTLPNNGNPINIEVAYSNVQNIGEAVKQARGRLQQSSEVLGSAMNNSH